MPILKLRPNNAAVPIIELTIKGDSHKILVDTGASHSVFAPSLVAKFVIPDGSAKASLSTGICGSTESKIIPIRFNFCGVFIREIAVLDNFPKLPPQFTGIIGQDILTQFSMICFDNKNKVVRFEV